MQVCKMKLMSCVSLSKYAWNIQLCLPNLHSVCNILIMFQTGVIFLEWEKCLVLTSARQCFGSHAVFSLIKVCCNLIRPQRCQWCVNISCYSYVKWCSALESAYILGQLMSIQLNCIIFCNFVFHVECSGSLVFLDLFPSDGIFGYFCREYVQKHV